MAERQYRIDLEGNLAGNLRAAIKSARRLSGHPFHRDTLQFWQELLSYARSRKRLRAEHQAEVSALVGELQSVLSAREA
jgi:hypothetical protein